MAHLDYIADTAQKLVLKFGTRDPFKICSKLDVQVRYKDLGDDIKAFYFYHSRIRNIVLNNRVSDVVGRILAAHELGHDRLHRDIAMLKGFHEVELFNKAQPTEYEANIFAAELLIDDDELFERLNDRDSSFFGIAKELYVPAELLDFKFRVLKHKGYRIEAPNIARGDFLKNNLD